MGKCCNTSLITVTEVILDQHEADKPYCTHFGCGKVLTLPESLAGNKCLTHQNYNNAKIIIIAKCMSGRNGMGAK